MKRFLRSEAGAAVIWVLSALLLAAIISPWLYQAGKSLAENASSNELSAFLEWLGAAAGRSKFSRFFNRSLMLSALLLLPLLLRRIRSIRAANGAQPVVKVKVSWQSVIAQILVAAVISGSLLWLIGSLLEFWGAYIPNPKAPGFGKLLQKTLIPATAAALLEEWLFRGLLLGLWMRFARPFYACLGTSLLFAFVHFLEPPDGMVIADPGAPYAGFQLLAGILRHFADPLFFVTDFATLFAVGMILAAARVRTGKLWFPIGLHAGWIIAFKGFALLHRSVEDHPLRPWWVGDTLRSGILPLLTLGLTALICHWVTQRFAASRASR